MVHGITKPFWLIDKRIWYRLIRHARLDYPNEACGVLLCRPKRPGEIVAAFKTRNAATERLRDRYSLDPNDLLEVFERADEKGLDICGFYHSHPDYPAMPSLYDREMAWNGYVYLILEIRKGRFTAAKAWVIEQEGNPFREEALRVGRMKGEQPLL